MLTRKSGMRGQRMVIHQDIIFSVLQKLLQVSESHPMGTAEFDRSKEQRPGWGEEEEEW